VEGRAGPVVAELLLAAAGALGPGCGTLVRVRAGGLCGGVLQPALTGEKEWHDVLGVDQGVLADLQSGVIVLAPLLASAAAVFLPD
jgi:hypothetical protein